MNGKRSLRVWILSDGRAGHYNQSRGIVKALQSVYELRVEWIDMRLRAGFLRSLLRDLVNRGGSWLSLPFLHLFYRFQLPAAPTHLIVSAGGKTSFANAWLAKVLNVPNIYAGSLRRIRPECFSAVLTLEAQGDSERFLELDLPPSAIDSTELERAAAGFLEQVGGTGQRYWALLIGGDGAGYRFRQSDWRALAKLIALLAREQGIRWLIVGSRRTGRQAQTWLQQGIDADIVQAWYWFGGDDGFSMAAVLGAAEKVLVTEDSMTMLTEAIYAQKPVYSLRPQQAEPTPRYQRALQNMQDKGWLWRHEIMELLENSSRLEQQICYPLQQSPLVALGERLVARLHKPLSEC
jgi:mitochondrial fission protein ELM1